MAEDLGDTLQFGGIAGTRAGGVALEIADLARVYVAGAIGIAHGLHHALEHRGFVEPLMRQAPEPGGRYEPPRA